jgi:hypothetical protein
MATTTKIGRLADRIEALAERRWGRLTLEELTEQGRAKIKRGAAQAPRPICCNGQPMRFSADQRWRPGRGRFQKAAQ